MNPEKIVPVGLQHKLQAAADQADGGYYYIGDATNKLLSENAALPEQRRASIMDIYRAVGFYASKASNTIRSYAEVSAFWDTDHRDEFPQFGRHHILAVIPHAKGDTLEQRRQNAADVLYKALDDWESGIPTVDGLRHWLKADNGKQAWELAWDRVVKAMRRLLEREDLPDSIHEAVDWFLRTLPNASA